MCDDAEEDQRTDQPLLFEAQMLGVQLQYGVLAAPAK
jgi:hypothetical protein